MPQADSLSTFRVDTSDFVIPVPHWEKLSHAKAMELRSSISEELDWGSGFLLMPVEKSDHNWLFLVLFSLVTVFAFFRVAYHNKYRQLIEAFVSSRYMKQVVREELVLSHPFSIVLLLQFSLVTGLLLYWTDYLIPGTILPYHGWLLYLIYSGLTLSLIIIKALISKIIQFLIGEDGGMTENRYSLVLFMEVAGILLLPLAVLASFGPPSFLLFSLITGAIILGGIYLFRLFRGITVGLSSGTSVVYIFLYLCALEIIPLIVLVRALTSEVGS